MRRHGGHGGGVASDRPPAPFPVRGIPPYSMDTRQSLRLRWRRSYRYIDNSHRGFVLPSMSSVILEPHAWAMLSYYALISCRRFPDLMHASIRSHPSTLTNQFLFRFR